jgi:hypothetical protein
LNIVFLLTGEQIKSSKLWKIKNFGLQRQQPRKLAELRKTKKVEQSSASKYIKFLFLTKSSLYTLCFRLLSHL